MEKRIAYCGLNCTECDARIATMTDNNNLREKTAAKWRTLYNATNLTVDMINCTGCCEPGAKIGHCAECEIRSCAADKNYNTCVECTTFETCPTLEPIIKNVPGALENLKSLKA